MGFSPLEATGDSSEASERPSSRLKSDFTEKNTSFLFNEEENDRRVTTKAGVLFAARKCGVELGTTLWGRPLLESINATVGGLRSVERDLVSVFPEDQEDIFLTTSVNSTLTFVDCENNKFSALGPHQVFAPPYKKSQLYDVRYCALPTRQEKLQSVYEVDMVCAGLNSLYCLATFFTKLIVLPDSASVEVRRQFKLITYLAKENNNPVHLRKRLMEDHADHKAVKKAFNLQSCATASSIPIKLADVESEDRHLQLKDLVLGLVGAFSTDGLIESLSPDFFVETIEERWVERFILNIRTFLPVLQSKDGPAGAHVLKVRSKCC